MSNPHNESNLQSMPLLKGRFWTKKGAILQKNRGPAEIILHFFLRFSGFLGLLPPQPVVPGQLAPAQPLPKKSCLKTYRRFFAFWEICHNRHHENLYVEVFVRTRRGKIARLPLAVREELNTRLRNGEEGQQLVLWLNGLPAVLAVLAARFKGKPISECNLSNWKAGGYADWLLQHLASETPVPAILEMSPELIAALQGNFTDKMALLLSCRMLAELKRHPLSSDSADEARLWRELRLILASLKRYEYLAHKTRKEDEAAERAAGNGQNGRRAPLTYEEKERAVQRILGIDPDGPHLNRETDLFEGPGAEALNQQRQRLRAEMARKAAFQPGAI